MTSENSDLAFETNFTQKLCEAVATPRALSVWLCMKYAQHDELLRFETEPRHYNCAGNFADDYLVTQVMRKSVNLQLGTDPASEALKSWLHCHESNRETNDRFELTDYVDHPSWWLAFVKYLGRILGPLGPSELNSIFELGRHGPGAVAGVKGGVAVESDKFDKTASCSEALLPFAEAIMGPAWFKYRDGFKNPIVACNWGKFFTVLKNALIDRCCETGPTVNIFGQLGLGVHLRGRLRIFGVDLQDQGLNQFLASKAQEWHLATIDLRTASELMATEPLRQAMPDRWFHLFDLLRTNETKVELNGRTVLVKQHKFCAMGNGFTFPLQTAVFLSVVRAIVPASEHGLTTCYGDDIICPQKYAKDVCTALEYLGFRVNNRKSFLAGRFFESCGTDWFDSQNVRPFYLRRQNEFRPIPYSISAVNSLRRWIDRRKSLTGACPDVQARLERLWQLSIHSVPALWRLPVPVSLGDAGITMTLQQALAWPKSPVRALCDLQAVPGSFDCLGKPLSCVGWEGYAVKYVRTRVNSLDKITYGVLLSRLNRLAFKPSHDFGEAIHTDKDTDAYWASMLIWARDSAGSLPFSLGREPVRGLYGKPKLGWTTVNSWS